MSACSSSVSPQKPVKKTNNKLTTPKDFVLTIYRKKFKRSDRKLVRGCCSARNTFVAHLTPKAMSTSKCGTFFNMGKDCQKRISSASNNRPLKALVYHSSSVDMFMGRSYMTKQKYIQNQTS